MTISLVWTQSHQHCQCTMLFSRPDGFSSVTVKGTLWPNSPFQPLVIIYISISSPPTPPPSCSSPQLVCFPRTTCTRAFFAHDRRQGPCHQLDDVLYSAVMGLVFLFTFVDVGGVKATRCQAWLYQLLILLEQMALLSVWWVVVVVAVSAGRNDI